MNVHGFKHFVGVDGSEGMLEVARSCGLYQELKQSTLGEEPIPVQSGKTDALILIQFLLMYLLMFILTFFLQVILMWSLLPER